MGIFLRLADADDQIIALLGEIDETVAQIEVNLEF